MIKKTRATRGKEQNDQGNKKKITMRNEQGLKPPVSNFSLETTNPQDHPPPPHLNTSILPDPPLAYSTNKLFNTMCTSSPGGTKINEKIPGEQEDKGTRRPRTQDDQGNTQPLSPPLAHSIKEIGNKKTKEQEEQGHNMTRGNKKKRIP